MNAMAAIVAGGLLLAWPAALNGFPLVFIDTVSYLLHTTVPEVPWDKTQAYGPFLHLFHWRWSLWPAAVAQVLVASHLIWLAQRDAVRHIAICGALAALTSAPWILATLMPDAFTALVPLALFLLGFSELSRREALYVGAVATLAIAVHLSHLPLALALLAVTLLLSRPAALRAAVPLVLAVLLLCTANLAAFGRFTPSPHGSAFLLARLQADGPATELLRVRCPEAGWHLCAFTGRLPMDSDEFLWDAASPLNLEADGTPRAMGALQGAVEAQQIVAASLAAYPLAVAKAAARNALAQLALVRVGDTLGNEYLALSARRAIEGQFPARELAAFDAGAQMRGALPTRAAPFLWPHVPLLVIALAAALMLLWRTRDRRCVALLVFGLTALAANAVVTGSLSKPHDRYQARIAWFLPLAVLLAVQPRKKNFSSTTLPLASV